MRIKDISEKLVDGKKKSCLKFYPHLVVPFLIILLVFSIIPLSSAETLTLEYDESGNLKSYDGLFYEYNGFNQLSRVREEHSSGKIIAEYFYDARGDRIKKITYDENNNSETAIYIGDNFIRVKNSTGDFDSVYYYDESSLVAKKDYNGDKFFYHSDHLGGPEIVTNSSGDLVEENKYFPFGAQINGGNERYQFTGQEKDVETSLQIHGQRYYNPDLRQFTQPDSILPDVYDPQQLNRYTYANNNPQKFIDPSGNLPILPFILGALVIIGAVIDFFDFIDNPSPVNGLFLVSNFIPGGVGIIDDIVKIPKRVIKLKNAIKVSKVREFFNLGKKNEALSASAVSLPKRPGKLGGPEHRQTVDDIENLIVSRGLTPEKEFLVSGTTQKSRRFVDIAALDKPKLQGGKPLEFYQVGKSTKKGFPVSRERAALQDIKEVYSDVKQIFVSYNKKISSLIT